MFSFSDIKADFAGNEELSENDSPHLLRVIQSYKPNVFNSDVYNQKFGKLGVESLNLSLPFSFARSAVSFQLREISGVFA